MSWLEKKAKSDKTRLEDNVNRLNRLRSIVHDLGYFVVSSNSGGFAFLNDLLKESIVIGRPKVKAKLEEALIGENNQKLALDSPMRFQQLMREAETIIDYEIAKEQRHLREFED